MDSTLHLRPPVWLPILVALIAGGAYIQGKVIETNHIDRMTIAVTGQGEVVSSPDIATLSFGVQTGRQKTAEKAMEVLAERMEAIVDAVQGEGIADKDIKTERLNMYPSYDWDDGERREQGFEANQNVRVKVRDLDKVSAVLAAATGGGANQVGGVSFTIDDPDSLQAAARKKAIKNAKQKAKQLARDLGRKLGKIVSFYEEQGGHHQPYMMRSMAMDAGGMVEEAVAPPVPAGEQEVRASVNITYELR